MSLFGKGRDLPKYDGEHDLAHPKKGRLLYNITQRLVHRDIRGERLQVTVTGYTETDGNGKTVQGCRMESLWTRYLPSELEAKGYRRCEGLYDSIVWWGVPVFIRFDDFGQFDITAKDEDGEFLYSQDTPNTLYDFFKSHATERFIKGMAKAAMLPEMDLQKIVMLLVLVVGAVFGMKLLGVF